MRTTETENSIDQKSKMFPAFLFPVRGESRAKRRRQNLAAAWARFHFAPLQIIFLFFFSFMFSQIFPKPLSISRGRARRALARPRRTRQLPRRFPSRCDLRFPAS